jgi:hemerythrin-like domain-containing protein
VEDAVSIVQNFIENYHEKLEEEFIFPKFNKFTSKYRSLVKTLEQQHNIGRKLTARIKEIALHDDIFNKPAYKMQLLALLKAYTSMFRVHTSREDTELFPRVRSLMPAYQFATLSRIFEEREVEHFGKKGFQLMIDRVVSIEKKLGIYQIDRFNANVR